MKDNMKQTRILWNESNYLDFCNKITNEETFQKDYELIYKIWVLYDLYNISSNDIKQTIKEVLDKEINKNLDNCIIKKLLETAFIFANLNSDDYVLNLINEEKEKEIEKIDNLRNKAYRIAISIYYYWKYLGEEWKKNQWYFDNNIVIYRLFTRLWILSKSRNEKIENLKFFNMDLQWKIETTNKEINNKFCIKDNFDISKLKNKFWNDFKWFKNDEVFFSDFQNWVIKNLLWYNTQWWTKTWKSIAISAPTSAWKTFILKKYIIFKIIEAFINWKITNIVFIVPSKALINELKSDFIELFKDYNIKDNEFCNIHTHISWKDFREKYLLQSNLFITTQERLNFFYSDMEFSEIFNQFKINLVVVDEAHKVWYWYRWTLLSYIIWKIKKNNQTIQIVLLAPLLSKLNKFKNEFNLAELDEQFSNFWLVAKNEIIVSIKKIKNEKIYNIKYYLKIWNKEFLLFEKLYTLEKYLTLYTSFSPKNKMSVIPRFFSNWKNQSIIFRFWAETVVKQIKLLKEWLINNVNRKETKLSNYLNDILPDNFWLSDLLEKWLSYHNWRLPISIKSAIEDNFKKNNIKYLCANYTVLEWINLPAKNIFISKQEYQKKELNSLDIKNLIWRSWRLNHHLNWNIFFINFNSKKERENILKEKNTEDLENNFVNVLDINIKEWENESKFDRFLDYIKPGSTKYRDSIISDNYSEKKDFEYMLWYLVSKVIDENLYETEYITNNNLIDLKSILENKFNIYKNKKNTTDFFTKIWELIYQNKVKKEEKIEKLRESILDICNDELNIKTNWDKDFLQIIKKNIFIDPRRQLDFYDLVKNWEDWFIKDNIFEYSKALKLLSDNEVISEELVKWKEKDFIKKIEKKSENIKNILKQVQKYFIQKFITNEWEDCLQWEKHNWNNTYIFQTLEKWFFSKSLINILGKDPRYYSDYLKTINNDIQFNYLNAFSIYFELANLWYKKYLEENKPDLFEEHTKNNNFPQLDTNFIYYMELWTFYPNLVYLISRWVSRESAIWLKNNKIIKNPNKNETEKEYFEKNKNNILTLLKEKNKILVKEELEKFIY